MKSMFQLRALPTTVVLALTLMSTGWARGQTPDCYILSVGVDNYQRVNDLKGCIADASNTVAAFQAQRGKLFANVQAQILTDGNATHDRVLQQMKQLAGVGKSGDFVVIFLSGHGARANNNQSWYFLPHDYDSQNHAATALTDRQILDSADALVLQGKKVFVIIDACFVGQINQSARSYLAKYRNPQAGGLVLLVSSRSDQTSAALGQYSAYAKAFADAMERGDGNGDGKISIAEIHRYANAHANQLIKKHGQSSTQDSEVAWSPSISEHMPIALTQRIASSANLPPATQPTIPRPTKTQRPVPQQGSRVLVGSESLAGFGRLSFQLYANGRAVMHDAAGATEGTWQQDGLRMTMRFANGRVIYSGQLRGGSLIGEARNDRTSWTFSVSQQS